MHRHTFASMLRLGMFSLLAILVAGCGGGGGGGGGSTTRYSVGGTVTGLESALVLQNNGADDLPLSADDSFTFATTVADGNAYAVTILTQPAGQLCTVSNGTGTIAAANVTNVAITCASHMGGAIQGKPLSLSGTVSTVAGSPLNVIDGVGTAAKFGSPGAIASDGTHLYVADGYAIRKVVIATGEVSLVAGSVTTSGTVDGVGAEARLNYVGGMAVVGGNLYLLDGSSRLIRKVTLATGEVTLFAGSSACCALVDGPLASAVFNGMSDLITDGTHLYMTDGSGAAIRKIDLTAGTVTTLAGSHFTWEQGYVDNSDGTLARFRATGLVAEGGFLYVADFGNRVVRRVEIATGATTTLAGSGVAGAADGVGTAATFSQPRSIASDGTHLYVTDRGNYNLRKIAIAGADVTTLAGSGIKGADDGVGLAASFSDTIFVTRVGGDLFLADGGNDVVRKLDLASATVTTFAGIRPGADGSGALARFGYPGEVTTDGTHLYLVDSDNHTIRKIVIATGAVTTLAGQVGVSGDTDGIGADARFYGPYGITTDGVNLYVMELHRVRQVVIATGEVTTLAGSGTAGNVDGTGTAARFAWPYGLTTDGTNLYVADGDNHTIRQVVIATGEVTTLAGSGTWGYADGTGAAAQFFYPYGLTTDGTNLYLADSENHAIRKIVIATAEVTTLAGSPTGASGSDDGVGTAATFFYPQGITSDGTNLYVADCSNSVIRKVVIATGEVSTVAGTAATVGHADGTGAAARFNYPQGITTDGTRLFVSDSSNNTLRVIE